MLIKPEVILQRLKELDTTLAELSQYKDRSVDDLRASLSLRWTVERGLIAAANIIFDVADHISLGLIPVSILKRMRSRSKHWRQRRSYHKGSIRSSRGSGDSETFWSMTI